MTAMWKVKQSISFSRRLKHSLWGGGCKQMAKYDIFGEESAPLGSSMKNKDHIGL